MVKIPLEHSSTYVAMATVIDIESLLPLYEPHYVDKELNLTNQLVFRAT